MLPAIVSPPAVIILVTGPRKVNHYFKEKKFVKKNAAFSTNLFIKLPYISI